MRHVVKISVDDVTPAEGSVLRALGVPSGRDPGERTTDLLAEALRELTSSAEARGIWCTTDVGEFAAIYEGAGDNESPSPLEEIFPRAEALALFAVTVGQVVSERIRRLFDDGRLALGATLDAAASEAVELAAERTQRLVVSEGRERGLFGSDARALRYSPGYCGWNVTGQRALFERLRPEEIGIRLLPSCLMEPLKSISGVIVTGPPEVHEFEDTYSFCSECRTRECRARIRSLKDNAG